MSPKQSSSAIHSVHFYERDEALIQRLCGIIISAVATGNSVLVVVTEEHRSQLASALRAADCDLPLLMQDGRVAVYEVRQVLAKFMVQGLPDRKLFLAALGELVSSAKRVAWNAHRGVTVFGEMVAVLWQEKNKSGALELEALWNELLSEEAFHLHCAYPRQIFSRNDDWAHIKELCDRHSHVIGQAA